MKSNHPAIVQKMYDIILWMMPLIEKFPKNKRYTIGSRMENVLLEILDLLVEASYSRSKIALLKRANLDLEKFRFLARLAKDLKFVDLRRYKYISEILDEVGSMLGGWIKQQAKA